MHPPSKVRGLRQKAAVGAVETIEETMRALTQAELMRLTRTELFALAARMTTALSEFPEGSYEHAAAYVNLWNTGIDERDALRSGCVTPNRPDMTAAFSP
jgi:hypothetical protein